MLRLVLLCCFVSVSFGYLACICPKEDLNEEEQKHFFTSYAHQEGSIGQAMCHYYFVNPWGKGLLSRTRQCDTFQEKGLYDILKND